MLFRSELEVGEGGCQLLLEPLGAGAEPSEVGGAAGRARLWQGLGVAAVVAGEAAVVVEADEGLLAHPRGLAVVAPVVAVLPFDDEADAIEKANDSIYGLSGSIFTSNLGRAMRVSRAVESGNLSVNSHSSVRYWTPFGGYKQSGLGRALGPDSLDMYTETKNVFFNTES